MRAEPHLVVIHGEVRHRAAELEELLAGVAVALVLLDGVPDRLLGETVLQLERGDRQAVDEQAEVKRPMGLVAAVAELARDREAVLGVAFSGRGVAGRRCAVEKFDVMGPVLDPLAEHVDDAALADLALEAGQELPAPWTIVFQAQPLEGIRLRFDEERQELGQIDRVLSVVVVRVAADPAGSTRGGGGFAFQTCLRQYGIARGASQCCADQPFEAAFAGIGGHVTPRISSNGDLLQLPRPHIVYSSADSVDLLPDEGPSG